ncbi:hypothetical protein QBC35DRAFT_158232 [Podospora australis]|uniref:Secreted protein n=1 Tax=Podospora australis TaxID=1536484 RepID=A0AAN6WIR6_9PEZI|nr:hypothetical protein QBC35DRAFT_158232 [Podospora australis]
MALVVLCIFSRSIWLACGGHKPCSNDSSQIQIRFSCPFLSTTVNCSSNSGAKRAGGSAKSATTFCLQRNRTTNHEPRTTKTFSNHVHPSHSSPHNAAFPETDTEDDAADAHRMRTWPKVSPPIERTTNTEKIGRVGPPRSDRRRNSLKHPATNATFFCLQRDTGTHLARIPLAVVGNLSADSPAMVTFEELGREGVRDWGISAPFRVAPAVPMLPCPRPLNSSTTWKMQKHSHAAHQHTASVSVPEKQRGLCISSDTCEPFSVKIPLLASLGAWLARGRGIPRTCQSAFPCSVPHVPSFCVLDLPGRRHTGH